MITQARFSSAVTFGEAEQTMSSREIAQITGKEHRSVLRDCDLLNENYIELGLHKIVQSEFVNEQNRRFREYRLTKIQTLDLMTGYRVDLRIKVNRRWEELEQKEQQKQLDFTDPDTVLMLAQNWKNEQEKRMLAEATIEEQRPKVLFAETVEASKNSILVRELAKYLAQNGAEIGQNRFFAWLRNNKYLMGNNEPYQRYVEMGLFELKKVTIPQPDGRILVRMTPVVTGKGQQYFVNKFLGNRL